MWQTDQARDRNADFEQAVTPFMSQLYPAALRMTKNASDAEDLVQEAFLRALRSFDTFTRGRDARAWLLQIVRNSCYTWLQKNRPSELMAEFDEEVHHRPSADPERLAIQSNQREVLMKALESLPARSREVLVLRELEGCSYKEISEITGLPMGTVMSTLSRARERLQRTVSSPAAKEASNDM